MSKRKSRKSLYIRFFDNPMDDVVQDWLESIPKYQYGGLGRAVKTALFEYAQQMGFRLPDPEPEPEPKKVIKVVSARRRAQREALEAQQEAEKEAEMQSFIREKTNIDLPDEDDSDFLKKMAKSLEDTF